MKDETIQISQHAFEALVRQIGRGAGSNPNPDDPEPGPWGPVIRAILQRLQYAADPEPNPWRALGQALADALAGRSRFAAMGPQPEPWSRIALNPQPLPPRIVLVAVLTEEVIQRATLLFDLAVALPEHARDRAMTAAAAGVARYASDPDDGICPLWPRWPFPHPRRDEDLTVPFDRSERAVASAQFHAAARGAADRRLGEVFAEAASQLRESAAAASAGYEDASLVV